MAAAYYDLMLLLDAGVPDDRRREILSEVEGLISSGGEIAAHHEWGQRRLAYEIDHRPEADYRLLQFRAEPELLERLRHNLKIMDGVLRFRIIRLKGAPEAPPPPQEQQPRPREEREPEGRVAARAAADAPPTQEA